MAILCPNGHSNDDSNRFCDQCGAPLEVAAPAATQASSTVASTSSAAPTGTACPACWQENMPGTAFCDNCGAALPPPQPALDSPADAEPATGDAGLTGDTTSPSTMAAGDVTTTCAQCGTVNDAANRFCDNCGATLNEPAPAPAVEVEVPPVAIEPPLAAAEVGGTTGDESSAVGSTTADASGSDMSASTELPTEGTVAPILTEPTDASSDGQDDAQTSSSTTPEVDTTAADNVPPAPETATTSVAATVERCSNCGAELPPNAKFCMECGTKVESTPQMVRPTHCQNCGAELVANAKFCLECGTRVELVPASAVAQPPAAQQEQSQISVPAAATSSDVPAPSVVAQAAPPAPEAPQPTLTAQPASAPSSSVASAPRGTDQLPQSQPQGSGPRLVSRDGVAISLPRTGGELVVGREDPISGIHPEIDLTPHGGEAGGVSRRHAVIREENGQWSVIDLDSTNYTRVDGQRIAPNTPTPLYDGARVQFGRVELEFHAS